MSELSDEIRKMFGEGDRKRDAGLQTPEGIQRFDNLLYGENEKWQILDVYRPKTEEKTKLPVLVSVHGGAWVYGDKEAYQFYCMSLASLGFAVVNFTYRLAPEYKFPASLIDTNLVMTWIIKNQGRYGLDTEHIFAVGDSAGAHLLTMYAALCTNPEYAKKFTIVPPERLKLQAVALNCGMYSVQVTDDPEDMTSGIMRDYLPNGGDEKEVDMINVIEHITGDFPPVYLMSANEDFILEQTVLMKRKLSELGIVYQYKKYGTEEHPLGHVFHCDVKNEVAQECNRQECDFFRMIMDQKERKC